ncbi:MAG: hypothetical protein ACFE9T_15935 [Promethearchaeota archaeon]
MDITELLKKYDKNNNRKLIFLLRKFSDMWLSYKDIESMTAKNKSNICKLLNELKKNNLIDIQTMETSSRKDIRKKHRLSDDGHRFADILIHKGLREEEIRFLNLLQLIRDGNHHQVYHNLEEIISLFHKYGNNDNSLKFSGLVHDFIESVKKSFKKEKSYDHSLTLKSNPIQNMDKELRF